MAADNIDNLYRIYDVLQAAGDKISEHEADYITLLDAVKGSAKEKRLAAQFINKFFSKFPNLIERAIESQFDLCEDEDMMIRKQAVRALPTLCRDHKAYTRKVADILAQLLQVEDAGELSVVYNSLMALIKIDPFGTLSGLYNQILTGEEVVRDRCIKFLANKYRTFGSDVTTKEVEDLIIAETKKVLVDVTAEEFRVLMGVLGSTRLGSSVSGHQELVGLVAEQAELEQPFGTPDAETVDRLIACTRHALPYFSSQVRSTKFVMFMCEEVLPVLSAISQESALAILKLLAELCGNAGILENPTAKLQAIYSRLLDYMPLPPEILEGEAEKPGSEPKFEFSFVECLLYAFHSLGRQTPEYLTDNPDRLKDFRMRLQYFARGTQGYAKKLKEVKLKPGDKDQLTAAAMRTTSNILLLIKDLFHSPPSYKSSVILSWIAPTPAVKAREQKISSSPPLGQKRHTPITFGNGTPKQARVDRGERGIYTPPSGKYSEKISTYGGGGGGNTWRGGRGRGRGNFRGNRTWRNKMNY